MRRDREIRRQRHREIAGEIFRRCVTAGGIAAEIRRVEKLALDREAGFGGETETCVQLEVVEIGLGGIRVDDAAEVVVEAGIERLCETGVDVDLDTRIAQSGGGLIDTEIDVASPGADIPATVVRVVEASLQRRIA